MTDTSEPVKTNTREPFKEMRIVKFNGNEDEWSRWSKKFMASAKVKKFTDIIDGTVTVPKLVDNIDEKVLQPIFIYIFFRPFYTTYSIM